MKALIKKLNEIQQKMECKKTQYNKFGDYYFRNTDDILEALKPILGEFVILLSDEVMEIGGQFYVKSTARLTDGENSIDAFGWARETMEKKKFDSSQLTGTASTYARKYALNGLCAIDDVKDADSGAEQAQTQAQSTYSKGASTHKASEKQIKYVRDLVQQKWNVADFRLKFNVTNAEDLTAQQAKEAIEFVNAHITPQGGK